MKCFQRVLCGLLMVGPCSLLSVFVVPATAQSVLPAGTLASKPTGPDFLQTLGVGSRSIGMGGAFTALADDVTANFWNPARLSTIQTRQFLFEGRSVISNRVAISTNDHMTPGLNTPEFSNIGFQPGNMQLSFVGLVIPLENFRRSRKPDPTDTIETTGRNYYGHIGISYTLGGYYSISSVQNNIQNGTEDNIAGDQRIVNQFLSISYGNRTSGKVRIGGKNSANKLRFSLGYGGGVVFLTQDQHFRNLTQATAPGASQVTSFTEQNNRGTGTGYILGLSLGLSGVDTPLYRLGIAYRSSIKISGFGSSPTGTIAGTGTAFGDEIPSRLAVGLAYESKLGGDPFRAAVEEQFFSSANLGTVQYSDGSVHSQQDLRSAVANFHIGMEIEPKRSALKYLFGKGNAVRFGFYTNEAAAKQYTYYTNAFTFGYALQSRDSRGNLTASFEPTAEILTANGAAIWSLSGLYRF